ncbi:MAG: EAL domain-containing protein [Pseudomonadota bacterium]
MRPDNDQLIFSPEEPVKVKPTLRHGDYWRVLVVDDDDEVHHVTRLALHGLEVLGKPLQLLHAKSAAECLEVLSREKDIAVLLLDVVMENDAAGLQAVGKIRDMLGLDELRIILRTGQPGYAPEERVVHDYDINDYKTKSELTHATLTTLMIASIRSYQQIRSINQHRIGLQKIIKAGTSLLEQHSLQDFSEGVITQICSLLGLHAEGILCAQTHQEEDERGEDIYILGAAGSYAPFIRHRLSTLQDHHIGELIRTCLHNRQPLYTDTETVLYLGHQDHIAAVYLQTNQPVSEDDRKLLQVFLTNISIGYENVKLFQMLRNAAYIDPMTKLANRNEFTHQLQQRHNSEESPQVAVLIDIDHFSDVNDGLGQEVGNELLIAVANRLRMAFGKDAVVARVDADVFGVIGDEINLSPQSVLAVFESPFNTRDQVLSINATIGLGRLRELGDQGLVILKRVYIALNSAKKRTIRHFDYYVPQMEEAKEQRLKMIRQLRVDFALQRLRIWYQPQYNLHTRRIVCLEALLRWPQEDGSYIPPGIFIPIAEYSGLIVSIGAWVLEQACAQLAQFRKAGITGMRIAVNVSMPQFRSPLFIAQVANVLQRYQIEPGELELEITESVLMDDPETMIQRLTKLKSLGIRISVDDFGTGYSSLNYLRRLPLDKIKVDASFVRDLASEGGAAIAETIVHLGRQLGLLTIAEGVETREQEIAMRDIGCNEAQGFYFARPVPLEQLAHLLEKSQ